MGKKHFCFFQTAETGNRTPDSGVKGSGANHYPRAPAQVSIVGSLRDREVACSASDRQGSNFESCVWRTVSSQSSHHPQEVLLTQFSLYVHKGGLKPDSFHFLFSTNLQLSAILHNIFINSSIAFASMSQNANIKLGHLQIIN